MLQFSFGELSPNQNPLKGTREELTFSQLGYTMMGKGLWFVRGLDSCITEYILIVITLYHVTWQQLIRPILTIPWLLESPMECGEHGANTFGPDVICLTFYSYKQGQKSWESSWYNQYEVHGSNPYLNVTLSHWDKDLTLIPLAFAGADVCVEPFALIGTCLGHEFKSHCQPVWELPMKCIPEREEFSRKGIKCYYNKKCTLLSL